MSLLGLIYAYSHNVHDDVLAVAPFDCIFWVSNAIAGLNLCVQVNSLLHDKTLAIVLQWKEEVYHRTSIFPEEDAIGWYFSKEHRVKSVPFEPKLDDEDIKYAVGALLDSMITSITVTEYKQRVLGLVVDSQLRNRIVTSLFSGIACCVWKLGSVYNSITDAHFEKKLQEILPHNLWT